MPKRSICAVAILLVVVAVSCGAVPEDPLEVESDVGVRHASDARAAPPDAGCRDAGPDAAGAGPDAARPDATPDAASAGPDAQQATVDAGCLDYAAAKKVCGFASDETVCALSSSCRISESVSQCKINCEMEAMMNCFGAADVACLQAAVAQTDCAALKACRWRL